MDNSPFSNQKKTPFENSARHLNNTDRQRRWTVKRGVLTVILALILLWLIITALGLLDTKNPQAIAPTETEQQVSPSTLEKPTPKGTIAPALGISSHQ